MGTVNPTDVVIVGGGPAGITAARILAVRGLAVRIVDENPALGGQYLKGSAAPTVAGILRRRGLRRLAGLEAMGIACMRATEVVGMTETLEMLLHLPEGRMALVHPKAVLLAAGAREHFVPFPGWTLPGIMGTGAVQILLKTAGVMPGSEVMVAGSGVFPYAVAADILFHGGRVPELIDANPLASKIRFLPALGLAPGKLYEAVAVSVRLGWGRIPVRFARRVVAARGEKAVEAVVTARFDGRGNRLPGSETVHPCRCLAVGDGFTPNTELARHIGCAMTHAPGLGGWVVTVAPDLATSVPGVFAAGEITGIAGVEKSVLEGALAAWGILQALGRCSPGEYRDAARPLQTRRRRRLAFGRRFNRLTALPAGVIRAIPDETVVCRCEEITMGTLKQALADDQQSPTAIKRATRIGMGICQGRMCGPFVAQAAAVLGGLPPHHLVPASVRTPVKALPLADLAQIPIRL